MGCRKPILPSNYTSEQQPTPLEQKDIDTLVKWIATLEDEYLPAYCLHWGLGVSAVMLQHYTGTDAVVRKLRAFPNLCRRHLRKGLKTVVGFEDLRQVFSILLKTDFEILLLKSHGASSISNSNHMAYIDSIRKLQEQCRQQEITYLNKHPSLINDRCSLNGMIDIERTEIADMILELPEEYERIIWMHFIEHKTITAISKELGILRIRGIIEYCRHLISKKLGCVAPLDDKSIAAILSML